MASPDLFLSHSSDDAGVARELRVVLEAAGRACWMAPDDVVGTETWTEQILAAIESCRAMIVLISDSSTRSPHVSREVNLALGRGRPVLPIRIEAVATHGPLEYLLSLVQRVDAFPPPIEKHRSQILRRVDGMLKSSAATALPDGPAGEESPGVDPSAGAGGRARPAARSRTPRAARSDPPLPPPVPPLPPSGPLAPSGPLPPSGPLAPGTVLGAFTIEVVLGQGGMATVYRARQTEPKRAVALKLIRADRAADETYREQFLAETATLAALEHPSIVPIYAAGDEGGHLYIAMRLLDGASVETRIRQSGRLELAEVIRILEPIADAVDFAHAAGVVHRDLKPSNIILDSGGRPYLTDFGLGKRTEGGADLSDPGLAIGTLTYMAPEQFETGEDAELSPAVDIYALACVIRDCLTGQSAFPQATLQQVLKAKLNDPPPPVHAVRPDLPAGIDGVLAKGMARSPEERFSSAGDLIRALKDLEQLIALRQTSVIRPPGGASRISLANATAWARRNTAAAVLGTALGLVGVVAVANGVARIIGGGGASPSPSTVAVASPTLPVASATLPVATSAVPTLQATLRPSAAPSVDSSPYPNDAETTLLASIPFGHGARSTCARHPDKYRLALAMLACTGPVVAQMSPRPVPTGVVNKVYYTSYTNASALKAEFNDLMTTAGIGVGGVCKDAIPANAAWSRGSDPPSGDLACYAREGKVQYIWTHIRRLLLAQWLAPSRFHGQEYWDRWASDSGKPL